MFKLFMIVGIGCFCWMCSVAFVWCYGWKFRCLWELRYVPWKWWFAMHFLQGTIILFKMMRLISDLVQYYSCSQWHHSRSDWQVRLASLLAGVWLKPYREMWVIHQRALKCMLPCCAQVPNSVFSASGHPVQGLIKKFQGFIDLLRRLCWWIR